MHTKWLQLGLIKPCTVHYCALLECNSKHISELTANPYMIFQQMDIDIQKALLGRTHYLCAVGALFTKPGRQ